MVLGGCVASAEATPRAIGPIPGCSGVTGSCAVGSCVGARADRAVAEARTGLSDARWRRRPPERIGDGVISGGAHSFRVLSKVQTLITVGQFQISWELQCN